MGVLYKIKNVPAQPVPNPGPEAGWKGEVEISVYVEGNLAYRFTGVVDDGTIPLEYRPFRIKTDDVSVWLEVDTYLIGEPTPSTGQMVVDVIVRVGGVLALAFADVDYDVAPVW